RCLAGLERSRSERDSIAVFERDVPAGCAGSGRDGDLASGPAFQHGCAGDMVSMHVRIEGIAQPEVELAQQRGVAAGLLEDRIDQDRLARVRIGEEIGESRRARIVELAKYEMHVTSSSRRSPSAFQVRIRPSISIAVPTAAISIEKTFCRRGPASRSA